MIDLAIIQWINIIGADFIWFVLALGVFISFIRAFFDRFW